MLTLDDVVFHSYGVSLKTREKVGLLVETDRFPWVAQVPPTAGVLGDHIVGVIRS